MEIFYFEGKPEKDFGQPFAIVSVEQSNKEIKTELLGMFGDDTKIHITKPSKWKYPEDASKSTIDGIIKNELKRGADLIYAEIYQKSFAEKIKDNKIQPPELSIATEEILKILCYKHPDDMMTITESTTNWGLKYRILNLIDFYDTQGAY